MSAVFSMSEDNYLSSNDKQVAQLRIPPHSHEAEASVLGGLRKGAYSGEACGSPSRTGLPLGSHRQRVFHHVHGNLRAMVLDFVLSALIDVVDPERILRRIDLGQQPCF